MGVNGAQFLTVRQHSSKYLYLCSAEQINVYRFGTMWVGSVLG